MSSGLGNFMKNGWHPEKEGTTLKGQVVQWTFGQEQGEGPSRPRRQTTIVSTRSLFFCTAAEERSTPTYPAAASTIDCNVAWCTASALRGQSLRPATRGRGGASATAIPGQHDGLVDFSPAPAAGTERWRRRKDPRPDGNTAAAEPAPETSTPTSTSVATAPASPAPPPTSSGGGYLNQNALNRLGSAGVSVPALGIGRPAPPDPPSRSNNSSPAPPPRSGAFSPPSTGQMNELQNRFAKLGKSSGQSASPPPTEGTTMEQKQAALRTASNFHKDPKSVSMADARSAASTFNNFRQRHGEQVAAGVKSANNLNQKYGIADKVGKYAGQASGQQQQQAGNSSTASTPLSPPPGLVNALGKKKPPPPPPPKKKPQIGAPPGDDEPPPIPLATKPTF
uniref:Gmp synthase n=1 Tax=Colletotrichum fructicola (strain Nara gc5) TaxID=1213859 RepID=L2FUB1_COLFN